MAPAELHLMLNALEATGDPERVRILMHLARRGEADAAGLAERFEMTKVGLRYHLRKLLAAGLVADRREGHRVVYSVTRDALADLGAFFADLAGRPGRR